MGSTLFFLLVLISLLFFFTFKIPRAFTVNDLVLIVIVHPCSASALPAPINPNLPPLFVPVLYRCNQSSSGHDVALLVGSGANRILSRRAFAAHRSVGTHHWNLRTARRSRCRAWPVIERRYDGGSRRRGDTRSWGAGDLRNAVAGTSQAGNRSGGRDGRHRRVTDTAAANHH